MRRDVREWLLKKVHFDRSHFPPKMDRVTGKSEKSVLPCPHFWLVAQILPDMMTTRVKDLAQHSSKGFLRSVYLTGGVIIFRYYRGNWYALTYEQLNYPRSAINRSCAQLLMEDVL